MIAETRLALFVLRTSCYNTWSHAVWWEMCCYFSKQSDFSHKTGWKNL